MKQILNLACILKYIYQIYGVMKESKYMNNFTMFYLLSVHFIRIDEFMYIFDKAYKK